MTRWGWSDTLGSATNQPSRITRARRRTRRDSAAPAPPAGGATPCAPSVPRRARNPLQGPTEPHRGTGERAGHRHGSGDAGRARRDAVPGQQLTADGHRQPRGPADAHAAAPTSAASGGYFAKFHIKRAARALVAELPTAPACTDAGGTLASLLPQAARAADKQRAGAASLNVNLAGRRPQNSPRTHLRSPAWPCNGRRVSGLLASASRGGAALIFRPRYL